MDINMQIYYLKSFLLNSKYHALLYTPLSQTRLQNLQKDILGDS